MNAQTANPKFTVIVETTVNMSRDIDLDNPEVKAYEYEVEAKTEYEAKQKARQLFYNQVPHKGIWDIYCY